LAPDQRQEIAELLAMQIEQNVAMADLLLGHLVVHFRRARISFAQRVGERAVDAAVLVLIRNGKRENVLLAQFGKGLHVALLRREAIY